MVYCRGHPSKGSEMSECLGCQRLEDEKTTLVQLSTGQTVCSYCPEWMIECEAKWLLEQPLHKRQKLLAMFAKERRGTAIDNLKARMTLIFNQRKVLQKDQPAI